MSDSDPDSESEESYAKYNDPKSLASTETFWKDFTRDTNALRQRLGKPKLIPRNDEVTLTELARESRLKEDPEPVTKAQKFLKGRYGVHYDYIEAILQLLGWLVTMMLLYQYSGYHELMYEFGYYISIAFAFPFMALLAMYWVEIK
jgi:hypothetical protein